MNTKGRTAITLVLAAHAATWLAMTVFPWAGGLPRGLPLALPGAVGLPHAVWFNVCAFVVPGVVVAAVAWRARTWLAPDAGLVAGIAMRLWLLAALLFAAQGLLPLDIDELDGGASRAHAAVWMSWALAFGAGALLASMTLPAIRHGSWLAAAAVALALMLPAVAASGVADRMLLAAWSAWTAWLVWRLFPAR